MPRYTEEELAQLTDFIANNQRQLGGAMVLQMMEFGADEVTVHTELMNPAISPDKFIITSRVRPLTDELKATLTKESNANEQTL